MKKFNRVSTWYIVFKCLNNLKLFGLRKTCLILILIIYAINYDFCFAQISRTQIISNAASFVNFTWTANTCNLWNGTSCGGRAVFAATPTNSTQRGWVKVGTNVSMPYAWGGYSSTSQHISAMASCKSAGDICSAGSVGGDCAVQGSSGAGLNCASGLDCSGLVTRAWGLSTLHLGTGELPAYSTRIPLSQTQSGDILNDMGYHVRLVSSNNGSSFTVIESSGTDWKTAYHTYTPSQLATYDPRCPNSNIVLGGCGGTSAPINDDCSSAITLTPNTTCSTTSGDIAGATQSYAGNTCQSGLIQDVWYKFTASSNGTYTIRLYPSSSMDGIVEARQGSCTGIVLGCSDNGGGNGGIENLDIAVTTGTIYYIRVYEYNSSGNTTPPATTSFDICIIKATVTATLSVAPSSVSIGSANGSTGTFGITSNTYWGITDDASWLTVSPVAGSNDGEISLAATSANTGTTSRSATVTVAGTGVSSKTVTVTQVGAFLTLSVSPSSVSIGSANGSTGTFGITSNTSWGITDDASWLTETPVSGSNAGSIILTATSGNTSTSSRNGTVTITGGGITKTVLISQDGAIATSTIFISTASLPDFGSLQVGENSIPQTYVISGSNLISNISITAPNGFQISTNASSNFGSSMILSPSGGLVPNTTIYVRFSPSNAGVQSGNISHSSSGSTIKNVSVTGTGVNTAKAYQLEYVSGSNQTYGGGGIPNPLVVKVKNITDNVYVTNLVGEGLEIKASSTVGNQDSEFNNFNNYCGNGDNSCYGGSYYVPANSGSAYVLTISVALRKNNQDISLILITENITGSFTIPVIVTHSITNLTTNSAVSGGNVTTDGGTSITSKGVCWGPNLNPTILNSRSTDGTGNGSYSSNISGLTPNTIYHVRAYATNSVGTGYGSDVQFSTLPTAPIIGSINQPSCTQSYGSVVLNGLPIGGTWTIIRTPGGTTITGSGSNTTISGLDPGTYTFQVTNAAGSISGSSAIVTINAQMMTPTIMTSSVIDATQSNASSGGNVTSDGGATVTARGVCWSTTSSPTILNSKTSDGLSIGTFTSTITGLINGVTYHIRAYATNCKGTAYGSDIQYIHNSTGIEDIRGDDISVFPNPVSGMLNIVYKDENFETIMILNSQGRLLSKEKVIKPNQQLDFSLYDSGLYILEFIKKTNEVRRIKVIKQ